jgi:hypothetical protein
VARCNFATAFADGVRRTVGGFGVPFASSVVTGTILLLSPSPGGGTSWRAEPVSSSESACEGSPRCDRSCCDTSINSALSEWTASTGCIPLRRRGDG